MAVSNDASSTWDDLLSCADVALYRAKDEGRGTVSFFEPGMDVIFRARRQLELDIRRALDTNAFQLALQPLVGFAGRAAHWIRSAAALARRVGLRNLPWTSSL